MSRHFNREVRDPPFDLARKVWESHLVWSGRLPGVGGRGLRDGADAARGRRPGDHGSVAHPGAGPRPLSACLTRCLTPTAGGPCIAMERAKRGPTRHTGSKKPGTSVTADPWPSPCASTVRRQQDKARSFAERIASNAPLATQMTKRLVRMAQTPDTAGILDYSYQVMGTMMQTDDAKEAIAAFREKRTPKFTGR